MRAENLDHACPACGRPAGNHTLREWAACLGKTTFELPYEDEPTVTWIQERIRSQFGIDDGIAISDHIVCRASVVQGYTGIVKVNIPALILEFQIGIAGQPPETVAKLIYMGDEPAILAFGTLIQESSQAAVRAAGEL